MFHQKKFLSSLIPFLLTHLCASINTITTNQPIKDGDVLVSQEENFALGFFSSGMSSNRYVGIWYNKVKEQTVVWVANRDSPINDTSGVLSIDTTGNLIIQSPESNMPAWSTNFSAPAGVSSSYSAQLLDSGNLVVFDNERFIAWQSFDYPTNTLLPYMKLAVNRTTGFNRFLTSWKSLDDPGTGDYSYKWDFAGSPPELVLYQGSDPSWRMGPWNGLRWSGVADIIPHSILNVTYVNNQEEISLVYTMVNASLFSRLVLNESGKVQRLTWHEGDRGWVGFWSVPNDQCDYYGRCGAYGDCDPSNATDSDCQCLPGFKPRSPSDWNLRDGSGGCVRKRDMSMCGNGEGFVKVANAKVPDTSIAVARTSIGLQECKQKCLSNCSCTGFASADITKGEGIGSGCITWHGKLMDTRQFSDSGQDFYLRVDAVEFAEYLKSQQAHSKNKKSMVAAIAASLAAVSLVIISLICWLIMRKRKEKRGHRKLLFSSSTTPTSFEASSGQQFDESGTSAELPFFELSTVVAATDNFSDANKLGQGGFGTVYQGRLENGQEIAVKRLAKNSGQGVEEFKNEVTLIAKLQHRNLVRLLGYCIRQEEKMLIYEYLPNKGLDSFIFDKIRGSLLDWRKRFDIVLGIARGMLYLHQDSRLRIIHRDLKASNVLLDAAMNPKISDFGLARKFGGDQIEANTNRVVGTYGYMSPEYAMEGQFSVKSDVFSFGVLLLEIISGRKNSTLYQENSVNLIGHVWYLWSDDKSMDIVDSMLGESYPAQEVQRCIHIGLLCVQEFAMDRPTMSDVAFMLCHETALPPPKQPAFIMKRKKGPDSSSSASVGTTSVNEITHSVIEAR